MTETKRVPREPTPEMVDAAITTDWLELGGEWRAMYDAAPDVPTEADTLLAALLAAIIDATDAYPAFATNRLLIAYEAARHYLEGKS